MALDLEEQEQLDELKVWWNKHGKTLTTLVIAGLVAFIAWQGYQYMLSKKATEASNLFQALVTTDMSNVDEIKSQTEKLIAQYDGTPYAGRAALFDAKANYKAKDTAHASNQLKWAIANAKETSVQAIASLTLAGIMYEAKDFDGATQVLNAVSDKGYLGLKDNLLGDVLLAQGKTDEAKKAFETALENLDQKGQFFQLTKQKLEALGV